MVKIRALNTRTAFEAIFFNANITSGFGRCVSTASIGSLICSTLHPYATGVNLIIVCNGTSRYGSSSEIKQKTYKRSKTQLKITIFCFGYKLAYILLFRCVIYYFLNGMNKKRGREAFQCKIIKKKTDHQNLLKWHNHLEGMVKLIFIKTFVFFSRLVSVCK